ncbi:hypothetical protein RhiirA4_529678 [Rhizophagus irregularis]|uniref:Uncharacterized protein n=1 Tax=Rhizophagus irregularis TaxID=588596 RepID=A0A2I1GU84_9GLOM|nr:hypothetical protein RhiirA4_529678 [Rhizophagus irregularis]
MHIKGYTVELLVNGRPLKEYAIPITDLEPSTTGKSFVYNDFREQEFLSFSHFALAPLQSNYVIKVSSDNASKISPMLAFIYVDGCYDSTSLRLVNDSPVFKNGFKDINRQHKHYFEFNKSTFVRKDNVRLPKMQYGGLGSVSVYFYKARVLASHIGIIERNRSLKFGNDQKLPNIRYYNDIKVITHYSSGVPFDQPKNLLKTIKPLTKFGDNPVAVLHLHYRPYEWFIEKNIYSNLSSKRKGKMVAIKIESDSSIKSHDDSVKIKEEKDKEIKNDSVLIKEENKPIASRVKKNEKEIKSHDDSIMIKKEKNKEIKDDLVLI